MFAWLAANRETCGQKRMRFFGLPAGPFEAVIGIRKGDPAYFANTIANKPTEVIFAGIQDGEPGLIVRGLEADSAGKIKVERFESTALSYGRIGYFIGVNGHIRSYIKSHPDWAKDDYAKLAARFVELEIEAHPDLAGLPVSALQIDNKGDIVWLAMAHVTLANPTHPIRPKERTCSKTEFASARQ